MTNKIKQAKSQKEKDTMYLWITMAENENPETHQMIKNIKKHIGL